MLRSSKIFFVENIDRSTYQSVEKTLPEKERIRKRKNGRRRLSPPPERIRDQRVRKEDEFNTIDKKKEDEFTNRHVRKRRRIQHNRQVRKRGQNRHRRRRTYHSRIGNKLHNQRRRTHSAVSIFRTDTVMLNNFQWEVNTKKSGKSGYDGSRMMLQNRFEVNHGLTAWHSLR